MNSRGQRQLKVGPIAPGTPDWGFDATAGSKKIARDGSGASPTSSGDPVGRIIGHGGMVWQAEDDGHRPLFRPDAFGTGKHGIEWGLGGPTGFRWGGSANFGTSWTVYVVVDLTGASDNAGRLLSLSDDSSPNEYDKANGFNLKFGPGAFSEVRNSPFHGMQIPQQPLVASRVAFAFRFGTACHLSMQGGTESVQVGEWEDPLAPCQPTRAAFGYWVDNGYAEATRGVVARLDLFTSSHSLATVQARLEWYRQVYNAQ